MPAGAIEVRCPTLGHLPQVAAHGLLGRAGRCGDAAPQPLAHSCARGTAEVVRDESGGAHGFLQEQPVLQHLARGIRGVGRFGERIVGCAHVEFFARIEADHGEVYGGAFVVAAAGGNVACVEGPRVVRPPWV